MQVTSYPQILGQVICIQRAQRGWTQLHLATRMGFASSAGWSRIEAGRTAITLTHLRHLARELEVTPGQLLAHVDYISSRMKEIAPDLRILDKRQSEDEEIWRMLGGPSLRKLIVVILAVPGSQGLHTAEVSP